MNIWQGIAGGGEEGEKPIETAKREAYGESLISKESNYIKLASITTIPVISVCGFKWGEKIAIIPEFAFGVELFSREIKISKEHAEYQWFNFKDATDKLKWDSNKTALWELNYRLENMKLGDIEENIKAVRQFL